MRRSAGSLTKMKGAAHKATVYEGNTALTGRCVDLFSTLLFTVRVAVSSTLRLPRYILRSHHPHASAIGVCIVTPRG